MELFHHKHKCEQCGMEFKTKEELDEHMKTHMQGPEQPANNEQPSQPEAANQDEQPVEQSNDANAQEQPQNQDQQQ